ncbi:carbohydrate kinase family protein [Candidatus Woesearchaeota archaeon]|nr:carbohydrate kinase family protein [Candidatus Woesearchaeota archaeon]
MYDVISVGSATIDCFVETGETLFQQITKHMDEPIVRVPFGSKIVVDAVDFLTGGGGTNCAVSFARLGLKTAYLGKLGGEQSRLVLEELKKEKVDISLVVPAKDTGFSVVLDAKGHDRTILTYKASNNDMLWNELDKKKLQTKWFYMASMVGESYKTQLKLFEYAKKNGIKVAYNPSSYIAKQGYKKLKKLLDCTDILVFNKEEAFELLGEMFDIETALKKLKKLVNGIVVVTDGSKGCHCYADKYYYLWPSALKAKEATGAGDSFASAFVAGLIMGHDIPYCLQMGQANAESVIMHKGAKNDLQTYPQVQSKIKKNPAKLTVKDI